MPGNDPPTIKIKIVVGGETLEPIDIPSVCLPVLTSTHQRTLPKQRAGGVGSRRLDGSTAKSRKQASNSSVNNGPRNESTDNKIEWSPEGKTNRDIKKKFKQLSDSRDNWKSKFEASRDAVSNLRSAHKSEIELIKKDHEEKMVGAAETHRSEIDLLRAETARMEKNIKSLQSDVSYKEKERVRLENRVKFDQACTEKSHTKEIDTLEKNVKKEIEQRDHDILRLTNCQLSEKK